jgi:hypothetical protein
MAITLVNENGNRIIEVFDTSFDELVDDVAKNLRAQDFDEVFDATGKVPFGSIVEDWIMSSRRWIVLNKYNKAVAVLGVRPKTMFSDIGIPWLLGTKGLDKMKKFFVKYSKMIIEEIKKGFKLLLNFVDKRYLKAVRWLRWCGFTIEEAMPYNNGWSSNSGRYRITGLWYL